MDFGRIDDPRRHYLPELPPDYPGNRHVLNPGEAGSVRIGLATWGDTYNRGILYPSGAAPGDFLRHYGAVYSAVELSASYYGLPERGRLESWAAAVPDGFRFMPKVSREITHRDPLADTTIPALAAFLERIRALGSRLGPVLLQLSPGFSPTTENRRRLAAAVALLGPRAAVELRHPAWFADTPPAAEVLAPDGATLVVTDTLGARDVVHSILTAPRFILRFVACYTGEIDEARADAWAHRIGAWMARGLREACIFVHLDEARGAHAIAMRFARGIAEVAPGTTFLGPAPLPTFPASASESASAHKKTGGPDSPEPPDAQLPLFT